MSDQTTTLLKQIQERNLRVYLDDPSRLRADTHQEAEIMLDYRGRLLYELIQNADDAIESGEVGRLIIQLDRGGLWIANDGRPLSEADVNGLCGLSASTKGASANGRRASIGHKGMGFKSVLNLSRAPQIYSTTHQLRFDEARSKVRLKAADFDVEHAPLGRLPWPIKVPHPAWAQLNAEGMRVAILLPFSFGDEAARFEAVETDLRALASTTFLFLKRLGLIEVRVDGSAPRFWEVRRGPWRDESTGRLSWVHLSGSSAEEVYLVARDDEIPIGAQREGLNPVDWSGVEVTEVSVAARLEDETPAPIEAPCVHVFLPTEERLPYPILINGAFASSLSRRQIGLGAGTNDYNRALIVEAARLFTDTLLPALIALDRRAALLLLARNHSVETPLAEALYVAVRATLRDRPLVPDEDETLLSPSRLLLPPSTLKEGVALRTRLPSRAGLDHWRLPAAEWCVRELIGPLVEHGARAMTVVEAVDLLAKADPDRCAAWDDPRGVRVDPVLRALESLWRACDEDERKVLARAVRALPLFPIAREGAGWRRVALSSAEAAPARCFYPPHGFAPCHALPGLYLLHPEVCWGRLELRERQTTLTRSPAWRELFEIRDFRFNEVIQEIALGRLVSADEAARTPLRSIEALAAIAALSTGVDRMSRLPDQRLKGQHNLVNLALLEVPCVNPAQPEAIRWCPAYQAYFSTEWGLDGSIEALLKAHRAVTAVSLDVPLLVAPNHEIFEGVAAPSDEGEEGEGWLQWRVFFAWLGVNAHLRLIPFTDLGEPVALWTKTCGLTRPQGGLLARLDDKAWDTWRAQIKAADVLKTPRRFEKRHRFLYHVHDMAYLDALLPAAAQDTSCTLGHALYAHLEAHWPTLSANQGHQAVIAFTATSTPQSRTKPQKARGEELRRCGEDLWFWRLKRADFCPSTQGPRAATRLWIANEALRRRFGGDPPLPLLDVAASASLAEALGARRELSVESFSLEDATMLLEHLERRALEPRALRGALRGLMELLVKRQPEHPIEAQLPCTYQGQIEWRVAREVFFAKRRGRSAEITVAPIFILEGESNARGPLQACFGVRILEDEMHTSPAPGPQAFKGVELARFRRGLQGRGPALLARRGADRQEKRQVAQDTLDLRRFLRGLSPVVDLKVRRSLDGVFEDEAPAEVYIDPRAPHQALIRWEGQPWPPCEADTERLAEALCELFGRGLYEALYALIKAEAPTRILCRAGASTDLAEYQARLGGDDVDGWTTTLNVAPAPRTADISVLRTPDIPAPRTSDIPAPRTSDIPAPRTSDIPAPRTPDVPAPSPALEVVEARSAVTHPLWAPESLRVSSQTITLQGAGAAPEVGHVHVRHAARPGVQSHQRGGQTDLGALDTLGMHVAMTFERARLADVGGGAVYDVSTPERVTAVWPEIGEVFERELQKHGIRRDWPGFDLFSLNAAGEVDRLIELKSSGTRAQTVECTWNEWKSGNIDAVRDKFYLYLVGNLRSDLVEDLPFIRIVADPFGQLRRNIEVYTQIQRKIRLNMAHFREIQEGIVKVIARERTQ